MAIPAANVSLLVAAMDLKLVQLLRDAMRTTDAGCDAAPDRLVGPAATFEPRQHVHPAPVYEPRVHFHPEPLIEPRPVEGCQHASDDLCCATAPVAPHHACHRKSPIQPPWEVLPWENAPQAARWVKLILRRPDNVTKGSLIDCFM